MSGKKKRKGKADSDVVAEAFIQLEYSDWQIDVLDFLKNIYQSDPEMLNVCIRVPAVVSYLLSFLLKSL